MPWWVKAGSMFGVPIVILGFVLGQDAGLIPSVSRANAVRIDAISASLEEHRHRQEALIAKLTIALRVNCENSARNNQEYNNCKNIQ